MPGSEAEIADPAAARIAPCGHVLGVRIDAHDYASALSECLSLSACGAGAVCVAAANTHLVTHARRTPEFARVLESFDLVLPDGMPLVWMLRRQGLHLADRTYGPWFMRHAILNAPESCSHLLVGGTPECAARLESELRRMRPGIRLHPSVQPPFGPWDASVDEALLAHINACGADFVWVALGGVRQETWMARHRDRIRRGVVVGIGDGFALLAGMRKPAPRWMERCSLTWLHRLASEPRRLFGRYVKYNSLFLWHAIPEWLFGRRGTRGEGSRVKG